MAQVKKQYIGIILFLCFSDLLDAAELAGLPNVKFDNRYIEVVKHFNPPKEDE